MAKSTKPALTLGTPAHEAFISVGYGGMTKEDAETIIKERKANPTTWPYDEYKKAQAFLAALTAKPVAVSTKKPWQVNGRRAGG